MRVKEGRTGSWEGEEELDKSVEKAEVEGVVVHGLLTG